MDQNNCYRKEWAHDLNEYDQSKKNLPWGHNPQPHVIKHKEMKEYQNQFNPIVQFYKDKNYDNNLRRSDQTNMIRQVAINKDKIMRYEQTFDIVNHEDKLKGFENHKNYPTKVQKDKDNKSVRSNENYNIVSNIGLDKHNFVAPENRPKIVDENIQKPMKVNSQLYRDYDLLSNNYKEFDKLKKKVDFDVAELNAAENYWKKNDYDFIKGSYIDQGKEEEFLKKREEKSKTWGKDELSKRPSGTKGEGVLYNILNMNIQDKEALQKSDAAVHNLKKRYNLRTDIEEFYRNRDVENHLRKEAKNDHRISYKRFQVEDERGFDILNNKETTQTHKRNKANHRGNKNHWENIEQFCGSQTSPAAINNKIYRDRYDYVDVDQNAKDFKNERDKNLKALPKYEIKEKPKKLNIHKIEHDDRRIRREATQPHSFVDKSQWFNTDKSVNFSPDCVTNRPKYNVNPTSTDYKSDIFIKKHPLAESTSLGLN